MLRRAIGALVLAFAAPAGAQAVPPIVHLHAPECGALTFLPARLRDLLALELSVDGAAVVGEGEHADAEVRYEPEPCELGATRFVLRLSIGDGDAHVHHADMGGMPPATVPRALALELAEALRGNRAPAPDERADTPLPAEPERPAAIEPAPPSPVPPTRLGVAALALNTPDTGAALFGPRVFIDLPLGHDLPLALRADATLAFGPSDHDLTLAFVGAGMTVSLWARALPDLALRFGPRLFVGYGWAIGPEQHAAARASEDVSVGAGLNVGAELDLGGGVELLVEGEAGTHFLGLEYSLPAGRAGFLGAYWAADLALAWTL